MGAHRLRDLPALALVAAFALPPLLPACQGDLAPLVAGERVAGAAVVRLSDGYAIAARVRGRRAEVIAFRLDGARWEARMLATAEDDGDTVQLIGFEGETGEAFNTFVYGTADPEVSRVELVGFIGVGGQVVDSAWVIALREQGIGPDDLHWRFLSARGGVLRSGIGIR